MSYNNEELSRVNLIVNLIPYSWRERHLRKHFSEFGTIKNYRVMRYVMLGQIRSKGYGFVKFSTHEEALAAIAGLNGKNFLGRVIRVEFARSEKRKNLSVKRQGGGYCPLTGSWSDYCDNYEYRDHMIDEQFQTFVGNTYGTELGDKWVYNQMYDWEPRCNDEGSSVSSDEFGYYQEREHRLVITNLPREMNEQHISSMCTGFAHVNSVTCPKDNNGLPLGVAYIVVPSQHSARCLYYAFHGCEFSKGRHLRCVIDV